MTRGTHHGYTIEIRTRTISEVIVTRPDGAMLHEDEIEDAVESRLYDDMTDLIDADVAETEAEAAQAEREHEESEEDE